MVNIMVCHHQIIVMTMKCPQKNWADVKKEPRGSQPSVECGGYVTIWWGCSGLLYNVASFAGRCVTISSHVTTPFSAKCWLRRSYSIKFLENSCSAKDRKEDWILSRNIMPKKQPGPPTGGFHAEWCPDEGEGFGPPQVPAPSITSFGIWFWRNQVPAEVQFHSLKISFIRAWENFPIKAKYVHRKGLNGILQ